jgi:hypothetical protein
VAGVRRVPHRPQKAKPGGLSAPQLGQVIASLVPHLPQKANPSGFSKPHAGHFMTS